MRRLLCSVRFLARLRLASAAAALLCLLAFLCCRQTDRGVQLPSGPFISCGDACLKIGLRRAPQPGVFQLDCWRTDFTFAWRPFHVAPGFAPASPDYLAIPLWLPLLVALPLAGWSHGRLAGLGLRPGACRSCGYDLSGCRVENEAKTCPECGERHPIAPGG